MTADTREAPAPESYPTFWQPVPIAAPVPPAPPADATDAYQEFVNVTEDVAGAPTAVRA